jgi:uncharacterized membrane protein HdeD (DUF308 family)
METKEQIESKIKITEARIAKLKREIFWLDLLSWLLLGLLGGIVFYHCNTAMVEAYNHKLQWQRIAMIAFSAFACGFAAFNKAEEVCKWIFNQR